MSNIRQLITTLFTLTLLVTSPNLLASPTIDQSSNSDKMQKDTENSKEKLSKKTKKQTLKYSSVNINSASEKELMLSLKGIGKKKAKAIIDYRKKHGQFKAVEDLIKVKGIGEKLIEKNKQRIRFEGKNVL
ncbi:ComEA family DNA-binding protein [Candidatus Enterovibrio escicola]|mgnify:FL=1|uniref:ComEA family DNA-binding protein n=1 Tax=Candidatus Enterovibrio escicola TaxID=1927127 RepID=UPI0012383B09|nr:helix-hairpin-helix domain-containing protein [Candidatus Enterovibrio escacola]